MASLGEQPVSLTDEDRKTIHKDYDNSSVEKLSIDGCVILKMIQHSLRRHPQTATGILTGVFYNGRIETTECFPNDVFLDDERANLEFQKTCFRNLRGTNRDYEAVGLYVSCRDRNYITEKTLEPILGYQKELKQFIVLLYDPVPASRGILSLTAVRLSQPFIESIISYNSALDGISKTKFSGQIFEEIPIHIMNLPLTQAYLSKLEISLTFKSHYEEPTLPAPTDLLSVQYECLDIDGQADIERGMGVLTQITDDLANEQVKMQNYYRLLHRHEQYLQNTRDGKRDERNEITKMPAEPSCFKTILLTNQIEQIGGLVQRILWANIDKLKALRGRKDKMSDEKLEEEEDAKIDDDKDEDDDVPEELVNLIVKTNDNPPDEDPEALVEGEEFGLTAPIILDD